MAEGLMVRDTPVFRTDPGTRLDGLWTRAGAHWIEVVARCISGRRFEPDDDASRQ